MREELKDRRQVFYNWKAQGVKIGGMPLHYHWQVWEIPEVDGDINDRVKTTKVTLLTDEEKSLLKEKPPGWAKRLKEINDKRKADELSNSRGQGDT